MKVNPILRREAKVKMRNWRAPFLIGIYVAILGVITAFMFYNTVMDPLQYRFNSDALIDTYVFIAVMQFLLIAFIVPALTSSSISGERERQTLDLLLCTKLKPRSIILGKLLTSISLIILLIIAALPVFSFIFLIGGISFKEIFQLFIYYIVLSITFGSIGIFFSTYIKKTTVSTVLTYGVILFLMLGTLMISIFYLSIKAKVNSDIQNNTLSIMYFNPVTAFISLVMDQFGKGSGLSIPGIYDFSYGSSGPLFKSMSIWQINIIVNLIISLTLLSLSVRKLNPMKVRNIKKLF
ncbi:ABC transporter permease [Haloimpatiens sp. FM7315]|uniref:ABC transporter permease n=1 Tax=Haloimpatiens sp. FM7315 TaxID=3298609 RepID=UPI0035A2EA4D